MMRTLIWIGLGAAMMYYIDPDRGRSRRARVRDRILHLLNEIDHEMEVTSHDIVNRTHGLIARTRSFLGDDHAPDVVVVARVRSILGREVSHPHAICVSARGGYVTLSGPVLTAEVDRLLGAVRSVRGVAGVEDSLQVFDRSRDHPALQGGRPRTGKRPELWQETGSPTMRLLAVTMIGFAALRAAGARRLAGLALGTVGAGLVARMLTVGIPRRGRTSERSRSLVATGAPVHDVALPIHQSPYERPEIGL